MTGDRKVPRRISQTVLNSLKGGVVPRIGLPYIAVGRRSEIEALLHDVDVISEGGASSAAAAISGAAAGTAAEKAFCSRRSAIM